MVLIFLIIKLFSAKNDNFKSMDMKLMRCKKLLPLVLPISSVHFSGKIFYGLLGLLIWPPKKGLNGKALFIPMSTLYIMRRRPSTFFIHVRISSAKQIFTLDLIFVAHNSCGQSWVIFFRSTFLYRMIWGKLFGKGSNEKQGVKN